MALRQISIDSARKGGIPIDWSVLLEAARSILPQPVSAVTYDGAVPGSSSHAQRFTCSDGDTYSVKFVGNQHGSRVLATEQIIGALALYVGAPVPAVAHVEAAEALLTANGILVNNAPAVAGVHHGSRWERGCGGRLWLEHAPDPVNRERFAALHVLYSWTVAADHQVIYKNDPPHFVFSVDHGHFLPGGPNWSAATLAQAALPTMDPQLASLALERSLYRPFAERLAAVTPEVIASCVARVHPSWAVPDTDLLALAEFLLVRAPQTVQLFMS